MLCGVRKAGTDPGTYECHRNWFVEDLAAVCTYVFILSICSRLAGNKIDAGMDPDSGSVLDPSQKFFAGTDL